MSDYFLADRKAKERARERRQLQELKQREALAAPEMKVTLLGDFLFPTTEPQGCDPYNSTKGKTSSGAGWNPRRDRR